MADLVSGRYPQQNQNWSLFGQANNAAQSDVPAFTNITAGATLEDGAAIVTKEVTVVPIFVPYGVSITKASIFLGATKQETVTYKWSALYTAPTSTIGGVLAPKLITQSANSTTAAASTTTDTYEYEKTTLVTPENAPNGFLYVAFAQESTKVGTYASFKQATALTKAVSGGKIYPWVAGAPIGGFTCSAAFTTTAATELVPTAVVGVLPAVLVQ